MAEKTSNNLQDVFLNALRKAKTPVTMFLVKGVKLQGIITWFDNFSVLLRRDGQSQLIYKHAISTIMPASNAGLGEVEKAFRAANHKGKALQDVFLAVVEKYKGSAKVPSSLLKLAQSLEQLGQKDCGIFVELDSHHPDAPADVKARARILKQRQGC